MQVGQRVRSTSDGQIGFVCEVDTGGLGVRLDRGTRFNAEQRIVPYHPQQWTTDDSPKLSKVQAARVCYEADRALRTVRGEYGIKEWNSLSESARIAWLKAPVGDPVRQGLYADIVKRLAQE